jgi:hypothetical protein
MRFTVEARAILSWRSSNWKPKDVVADQLPGRQTWMPFRFQLKNLLSPLPSMAVPGWAWFFS